MNRILNTISILLLLIILSCDTSSTVEPRNESFFIKFYDGFIEGDDFGAAITPTSDNGLAFVGTSYSTAGPTGPAELLVVKTGLTGELEWKFTSSAILPGQKLRGKTILELNDGSGLVVGGTTGNPRANGTSPFLVVLDPVSGTLIDSLSLSAIFNPAYYYELKSITQTHNYLVISGETNQPSTEGGGVNGFIAIVEPSSGTLDFPPSNEIFDPKYIFGVDGDEVVAGAFEISDTLRAGTNGPRFIALCGANDPGVTEGYDFSSYRFTKNLGTSESNNIVKRPGDQIPGSVARIRDEYFIVGTTTLPENQMYMQKWDFNVWANTPQGRVSNSTNVEARGIALQSTISYVLVGDLIVSADVREEIYLAKVNDGLNVNDPWPRLFGNQTSAYNVSDVEVLDDGSIVILGTADLEPIKKIVVIKTGPNGEMNFE